MDPERCVPLRDSYEVFTQLKKTLITVQGKNGYRVVDSPDTQNGFTPPQEWKGGAATWNGEWLLFLANSEHSDWISINSCRPEGMRECDVSEWRDELFEWLDCFYGFKYR